MEIIFNDTGTVITSGGDFDIKKTFECGQCFRFDPDGDGYTGTAFGRVLHLTQCGDTVTLCGVGKEDFKNIWEPFFDIDRDYSGISHDMCTDDTLSRAYGYSRGIRILAQDPWETLCSFIISQNNNIPRIKKIIGLLCTNFGERIQGTQYYSFPSARRIADAGMEALDVIRSGFRSKYIYDAAVKVADGSIDLELLKTLPYEEAKSALMSIKGVGEKVAKMCIRDRHVLVDRSIAKDFLPRMAAALDGVDIRGDAEAARILGVCEVGDDEFFTEYDDMILSVKVVGGLEEAIEHINSHSTKHSDLILTKDLDKAAAFTAAIDSAAVYVNASTRFTDGGEFGFGAEIGISTQKLHARGPMGLDELTTVKYIVTGSGQVR